MGCKQEQTASSNSEKYSKSPFEIMYLQRAYPTGQIKAGAAQEAKAWKKQNVSTRSLEEDWQPVGPVAVGGRVTDIEIPIDEAEVYYVGAASGGVFKSTDAGASFIPIFDEQGAMAIGDIEISKQNTDIVWVGTGEANPGGGSLAYEGDGVYVSSDAGQTWTNKGLSETGSISKVLIDPNDDNVIFAGAMGRLFSNDNNRGLYRSRDNGDTWEQILFVSDSTGVIDMVNHPTLSNVIFAVTWERIRTRQDRQYGGATSGIHRSIDGGDTWQELTNGLPTDPTQKGRIGIDISQSNPLVLYARYSDAAGSIEGVYRTNNGGESWTEVNSSQLTNVGFHWWFSGIHVDPNDENTIYNVDFEVQKSTDGGNTWFDAFPGVHVDQHALAFNAMADNEVLVGNDGGVYKSTDGGNSSGSMDNLAITQFYRISVDPNDSDVVYGGSQDNGTWRTRVNDGVNYNWANVFGGDGFQPLIHTNGNTLYAQSQRGNLVRSNTRPVVNFVFATNGINGSDRNNWDTPIVFDPQNNDFIYYGTNRVWRSENNANTWSVISPDLTDGPAPGILNFGTITTIDVSPVDSDVIIVGTDDSNIWITTDGGANWNNTSSTLPNLWTTKVLADREDPSSFYVTFSGYRYGNNFSHVFRTVNSGADWIDIGSGLPDIPINDIVQDKNANLYLATDVGVLSSSDEGELWTPCGGNMPDVVVTDLAIHDADDLLFAGTYGRSAFKLDIEQVDVATLPNPLSIGLKMYPNPSSNQVTISIGETIRNATAIFYNSAGQKVLEQSLQTSQTTVQIGHLAKGMYFVRVQDDKYSTVKKLSIH